jgi:hypothetical protein
MVLSVALFEELKVTENANYKVVFVDLVRIHSNLNRTPPVLFLSFREVVDQLVPLEIGTLTHWTEMMHSLRNSRREQGPKTQEFGKVCR